MPQLPQHIDDNFLNEIRANLNSAPNAYREMICKSLKWSYTTYYKNTGQAKSFTHTEMMAMLEAFALILQDLENILIAMCKENGFVYGVHVKVNWYKGKG